MSKYFVWLFWVILYLFVSSGIGQVTQSNIDDWYKDLIKSTFNPPDYVFPIVWTVIYSMVATAGHLIWQDKSDKDTKTVFILYTIMNWSWSFVFFEAQNITVAFGWIIAVNLINIWFIIKTYKKHRWSSVLMIPPLLWTGFASFLTYEIWRLNG